MQYDELSLFDFRIGEIVMKHSVHAVARRKCSVCGACGICSRYGHADTQIRTGNRDGDMELFSEVRQIPMNQAHAASVRDALIRKVGADT